MLVDEAESSHGAISHKTSDNLCAIASSFQLEPSYGYHPIAKVSISAVPPCARGSHLYMILPLSTDLFADPYELARLDHHGALVYVNPYPDLEVPANDVKAKEHAVFVSCPLKHDNFSIDIPLHMRYQPAGPSGQSHVNITIPPPLILVSQDSLTFANLLPGTQHTYTSIDQPVNVPPNTIIAAVVGTNTMISVPAGNIRDALFIAISTLALALLSSAYIAYTAYMAYYAHHPPTRAKKQA
ncbi:hypothetical protein SeMB42_g04918 [Synchytrium endobioticum]|uniref:Protein PBN1 n=1 Tax=Synchytrium endobioticum TaxID=286115 RepID=A0A507CUX3_9FUNG|nr:hypothetical protein SeMB42_g04918 [Synchytrium endobioticum]